MACDGLDEFEMPTGVEINQDHPLMTGARVGPGRLRVDINKMGSQKKKIIRVKVDLSSILELIDSENCYACDKFGHDFDDHNTLNDWVTYINIYLSDASRMNATPEQVKAGLVKAANLCVSALAALERNGKFPDRHYDKVAS
jgi:hypothetical protein